MKGRHLTSALSAAAAVAVAVACHESAKPLAGPNFWGGGEVPTCANFRLTGGGRTDTRSDDPHSGQSFAKNTPGSLDFATFGFQARPDPNCPSNNAGSGQQEWNEHGTNNVFGAPFAFHGVVTTFAAVTGLEGQCGTYGGPGRINFHSGDVVDGTFTVNHACDVAEPGVGKDHISISITRSDNGVTYNRHGLLSGGNIQWHPLTGK